MVTCSGYSWVEITYTIEVTGLIQDYFVYVSGEVIPLGKAETESLLEIHCKGIHVEWTGQLGRFRFESDLTDFLLHRAAFVKKSGRVIAEFHQIGDIPQEKLVGLIPESETFAVRALHLGEWAERRETSNLSAQVGHLLLKHNQAEVSLEGPDILFLVICSEEKKLLTVSQNSKVRKLLELREPGRKKFFHPSMMNAKLARAMVNLAQVMPDSLVLDPFCGAGGILCEAVFIGARGIGLDVNWRLLRGAQINLADEAGIRASLVQGDARYCPVDSCDCIVTDPPYGRASSTRGSQAEKLVEVFLNDVHRILDKGGRMCLCASSDMKLRDVISDLDIMIETVIDLRVHSGLTRQVFSLVV